MLWGCDLRFGGEARAPCISMPAGATQNVFWNRSLFRKPNSFIREGKAGRGSKQAGWLDWNRCRDSGTFQMMGCLRAGPGQTTTIETTGSIREYLHAPVSFSYAHLISVAKGNRPQLSSLRLQLFTNTLHKCKWTLPTSADRLAELVVLTLAR